MNSIIVDDNQDFCLQLQKTIQLNNVCKLFTVHNELIQETTLKISEKISEELKGNNSIPILINIEGKYSGSKRQDQKGIEILLWLRCKFDIHNPVVVYSFQTIHQLLNKRPENYIICSKGSYHYQLPYDFSQLELKKLEPIKDFEVIKQYLKPAFSIEEFRHREANWWGIVQLIDVHRFIFPEELKFGSGRDYPEVITKKFNELNNIIALNLYGHYDFRNAFEALSAEKLDHGKKELKKIVHDIGLLEKKLNYHPARRNPRPEELSDFLIDRKNFIKEIKKTKNWRVKYEVEKTILETEEKIQKAKTQLDELKNREIEIEKVLDPLKPRSISVKEEFKKDINELSFRDISYKPRIIYIDDQAKEGWSEIFQFMLYGEISNEHFITIDLSTKFENIEDYIENNFSRIKPYLINADLILLDLRLLPSLDEKQKFFVEEMSGAKLLKRIRTDNPGIPIIITTASNKVWSYEILMRLGADAYWIKEGLDTQGSSEQSVKNYLRFLELVNKLTGEEYKLLKYFSDEISKLKNLNEFWWTEYDWRNIGNKLNMDYELIPYFSITPKENIFEILENTFIILRDYLRLKVMRLGFDPYISEKEWFFPSQIIQNLGKIIEEVHNFDIVKNSECKRKDRGLICGYTNSITKDYIVTRNDKIGDELYGIRNRASHIDKSKSLKWINVKNYIEKIMMYLNQTPLKKE